MRISDWSSDVCSSDLWGLSFMVSYCHDTREEGRAKTLLSSPFPMRTDPKGGRISSKASGRPASSSSFHHASPHVRPWSRCRPDLYPFLQRSEEHTSELQSLMRISYAVFCLKKKN